MNMRRVAASGWLLSCFVLSAFQFPFRGHGDVAVDVLSIGEKKFATNFPKEINFL
jgi:hypothetical protein